MNGWTAVEPLITTVLRELVSTHGGISGGVGASIVEAGAASGGATAAGGVSSEPHRPSRAQLSNAPHVRDAALVREVRRARRRALKAIRRAEVRGRARAARAVRMTAEVRAVAVGHALGLVVIEQRATRGDEQREDDRARAEAMPMGSGHTSFHLNEPASTRPPGMSCARTSCVGDFASVKYSDECAGDHRCGRQRVGDRRERDGARAQRVQLRRARRERVALVDQIARLVPRVRTCRRGAEREHRRSRPSRSRASDGDARPPEPERSARRRPAARRSRSSASRSRQPRHRRSASRPDDPRAAR